MTNRMRAEKWLRANVIESDAPGGDDVGSLAAEFEAVRLEAIEECAGLCDSLVGDSDGGAFEDGFGAGRDFCASAIRKLKEVQGVEPESASGGEY